MGGHGSFNFLGLPSWAGRGGPGGSAPSNFDLTLYVSEAGGDVFFNLVYNVALFDEAVERLANGEDIRAAQLAARKRRLAPQVIKIKPRAFGRDRRMPNTNGYRA